MQQSNKPPDGASAALAEDSLVAIAASLGRKRNPKPLDLDALLAADDPMAALEATIRQGGMTSAPNNSEAAKESQATRLVSLALERYDFGVSSTHIPFLVPKNGPRYARALKGGRPSLAGELAKAFHAEHGGTPSKNAIADATTVLEGYAQEGTPVELAKRVGRTEDGLVLDLGTPDGRAVVVNQEGWQVVDQSPVLFRRSNSMLALPEPAHGGSLDGLRRLLNVSDEDFGFVVAWLVAALIPNIPHAILVLQGEQGTAKTSATKMLARIVDPQSAQTRALPGNHRDWIQAASGNHVIALDNVSHIERWLSDALARAVTGEGWVTRTLYEDDDQMVFEFRNVLLINGIDLGALRGDLAERMASVELQVIPQKGRRREDELWARFDAAHPAVLGALLDLTSEVLRVLPSIHLDTLPRMADFAQVVAAVDRVRGTRALDTYLGLAEALNADVVASDPVAQAVEGYVLRQGAFDGTSKELLTALEGYMKSQADGWWKPPRGWPQNASYLGRVVRRLAPALRSEGVEVEQGKTGSVRWIRLRHTLPHTTQNADDDQGGGTAVGQQGQHRDTTKEACRPTPELRKHPPRDTRDTTAGVLPSLASVEVHRGVEQGNSTRSAVPAVPSIPQGGVFAGQGVCEVGTADAAAAVPVPSHGVPAVPRRADPRPVCVCTFCGYQARLIPRATDGITPCPRCGRSMVATAEKWARLSNKPLPAVLDVAS
jgi:hypothetical protein